MRDWNGAPPLQAHPRFQFVAYLWGIETIGDCVIMVLKDKFVAYLWGIETVHKRLSLLPNIRVCSLPMRDWNMVTETT